MFAEEIEPRIETFFVGRIRQFETALNHRVGKGAAIEPNRRRPSLFNQGPGGLLTDLSRANQRSTLFKLSPQIARSISVRGCFYSPACANAAATISCASPKISLR